MKKITIYNTIYWTRKGYSEVEAIELVEKSKKETSCWNKEFWIVKKGYSEEEAIKKVKEVQSKNSKKRKKVKSNYDIDILVDKGYTKDDAIKRVNELKKKSNVFNILSDEDIEKMMENRKKTYYSKSDEERALINKSRGRTKEQLIDKFGIEYTNDILKKRGDVNRNYYRRFSKVSKIFFDELQLKIYNKLYYAEEEKWIRYNKNKGYYVDLIVGDLIIEFNGDFFHANPKLYEENDTIKIAKDNIKIAKDIWEKDKNKINTLKEKGYTILVIWEYDVKNNRDYVFNECMEFLKNKTQLK